MPTPTLEPIATTTLGSAAASITFDSIPSTYTDLRLVVQMTTTDPVFPTLRINNDSTALYAWTRVSGDGANTQSERGTAYSDLPFGRGSSSSTAPGLYVFEFFNYTSAIFKTCLITQSADYNASGATSRTVGLYRSTAAITSLVCIAPSNTFKAGSTATLYGLKAA